MVLNPKNIARHVIDISPALVMRKRLERDDATPLLQVEEHVDKLGVQVRRERLVVDQNDISTLEHLVDSRLGKEIAADEVDVARAQTPQTAAASKLALLGVGKVAGVIHHLAPPALAADLEGGLEDDVADAGAQVDEDLVAGHAGHFLQDLVDEDVVELAVDVVGAVLVLLQLVDVGRDGAVVDLGEDELDKPVGDAVGLVEIPPEGAVLGEGQYPRVGVVERPLEAGQVVGVGGPRQAAYEARVGIGKLGGLFFGQVDVGDVGDDFDDVLYCVDSAIFDEQVVASKKI